MVTCHNFFKNEQINGCRKTTPTTLPPQQYKSFRSRGDFHDTTAGRTSRTSVPPRCAWSTWECGVQGPKSSQQSTVRQGIALTERSQSLSTQRQSYRPTNKDSYSSLWIRVLCLEVRRVLSSESGWAGCTAMVALRSPRILGSAVASRHTAGLTEDADHAWALHHNDWAS